MSTEESAPTSLLFSYGTLQQGERAEHHLSTALYLGKVHTIEPFLLVDCGQFPGLITDSEKPSATSIIGELYQVPDTLWTALDEYEGIHDGDYTRSQIRVSDSENLERIVEAYLWAQPWKHLPVVGPSWKTYRRHHYPSV